MAARGGRRNGSESIVGCCMNAVLHQARVSTPPPPCRHSQISTPADSASKRPDASSASAALRLTLSRSRMPALGASKGGGGRDESGGPGARRPGARRPLHRSSAGGRPGAQPSSHPPTHLRRCQWVLSPRRPGPRPRCGRRPGPSRRPPTRWQSPQTAAVQEGRRGQTRGTRRVGGREGQPTHSCQRGAHTHNASAAR